jgi:hypothetical protein
MARDSRPPGFDMTYRPTRRHSFGPPVSAWVFPAAYVAVSLVFVVFVWAGQAAPSSSWLFRYVVEGDAHRLLGARVLAFIVALGAVASAARTAMRGVVVHPDGIEARDVASLGWPKVRSCTWMEIDRVLFEAHAVGLQLWDGSRWYLPPVRDREGLSLVLHRVASGRAIPVKGRPALPPGTEDEDDDRAG